MIGRIPEQRKQSHCVYILIGPYLSESLSGAQEALSWGFPYMIGSRCGQGPVSITRWIGGAHHSIPYRNQPSPPDTNLKGLQSSSGLFSPQGEQAFTQPYAPNYVHQQCGAST